MTLKCSGISAESTMEQKAEYSFLSLIHILNRAKLMGYKTFQSDPLPDAFPSESAASINKSIALDVYKRQPVNCSVTHKPLDNKNNGTCYDCYQFVIKIVECKITQSIFIQ